MYKADIGVFSLVVQTTGKTSKNWSIVMSEELNEFKRELGVKWIKAESGTTYLCPVAALDRIDDPNEEQLKLICVDESMNPQND